LYIYYNSSKSFVCFWRRRAMKAEEVMSKVPEERKKEVLQRIDSLDWTDELHPRFFV